MLPRFEVTYHGSQHKPVVEAMLVDFEYPDIETGHEGEDGNGHDGDLDDEQSRPTMLWVIIVGLWPCSHHLERWVTHDDVVSVSLVVTFERTQVSRSRNRENKTRGSGVGSRRIIIICKYYLQSCIAGQD